jgi:hypothetical protein
MDTSDTQFTLIQGIVAHPNKRPSKRGLEQMNPSLDTETIQNELREPTPCGRYAGHYSSVVTSNEFEAGVAEAFTVNTIAHVQYVVSNLSRNLARVRRLGLVGVFDDSQNPR